MPLGGATYVSAPCVYPWVKTLVVLRCGAILFYCCYKPTSHEFRDYGPRSNARAELRKGPLLVVAAAVMVEGTLAEARIGGLLGSVWECWRGRCMLLSTGLAIPCR